MGNQMSLGLENLSPRGKKHKYKQYQSLTGSDSSLVSSCESPKSSGFNSTVNSISSSTFNSTANSASDTPRVAVQFKDQPEPTKDRSSRSSPSYEASYIVEYPDSVMYPPRRICCTRSGRECDTLKLDI